MQPKISLIRLFLIFFKISCVLFGGGYAILPFLKAEMADKEKICTYEEIADYYAMSQCFPGLVAGNISVLVGYKARGVFGALVSVLGVCLPAYLVIILVFSFLSAIMGNPFVQNIFHVLDIAVCVLIILTVAELWNRSIIDKFSAFIFLLALLCAIVQVSPFVIVIGAGFMGLLRHFFFAQRNQIDGGMDE